MLFSANSATKHVATATTADNGKIRLGAGCRLPVKTADTGKIRLGAGCRLPVKAA